MSSPEYEVVLQFCTISLVEKGGARKEPLSILR
jgi:hypothetical protein